MSTKTQNSKATSAPSESHSQPQQLLNRSDMKAPMSANVSIIPATKPSGQDAQLKMRTNIRVAAYCRVSTGDESQQTSYTSQKAYYSGLIHSKQGWKFAGMYADEGISGTSIAHRTQFNRMIADAKAGKIDYIVTKSISRFARNTLDTLTYVRELKELTPKVGIFFEKENLDTLDVRGEMVLTVLAAIAQEESHSISENIRWSIRKRFEAGIPQVNLNRLLGYDLGADGQWIVNQEQAVVVRNIFKRFRTGQSANAIAQALNGEGIVTVLGNRWTASTVLNILRNEKYVGDVEMQKTYTRDFLSHTAEKNTGELPRFYIENHHEAIICREEWNEVQARLQLRGRGRDKGSEQKRSTRGVPPPVFRVLSCGVGGNTCPMSSTCDRKLYRLTYSAKAVGYTDERSIAATGADAGVYSEEYSFSYPVWKHKAAAGSATAACPLGTINECALRQSFMEMLYSLKRDYEANGADSQLCVAFRTNYDAVLQAMREGNETFGELSAINSQIEELETAVSSSLNRQAEAMLDIALDSDADLAESVAAGEIDRNDILTDINSGLINPEQGPQFYHIAVPEGSQAAVLAELVRDLRSRLTELKARQSALEAAQESAVEQERSFEAFVNALRSLPKRNGAGMPIRVNGLDVEGSLMRNIDGQAKHGNRSAYNRGRLIITPERIAAAPDYLDFAENIFRQFITEGTISPEENEPTYANTSKPQNLKTSKPHDLKTLRPHDLISRADKSCPYSGDLTTLKPNPTTPKLSPTTSQLNPATSQHDPITSQPQDLITSQPQDLKTLKPQDRIAYKTSFGVTLATTGNSRSLGSFLGFKRSGVDKQGKPDGTIDFLDQICQIVGGKIWYKCTERKKKDRA